MTSFILDSRYSNDFLVLAVVWHHGSDAKADLGGGEIPLPLTCGYGIFGGKVPFLKFLRINFSSSALAAFLAASSAGADFLPALPATTFFGAILSDVKWGRKEPSLPQNVVFPSYPASCP